VEITACILKEMGDLCQQKGVKFAVVCLDSKPETEQLKKQLPSLPWLDADFDFHSKAMTNLPLDSHPNEEGHQFIAQQISPFLGELLHED
jgi:lysophospholipase L1-like esterase